MTSPIGQTLSRLLDRRSSTPTTDLLPYDSTVIDPSHPVLIGVHSLRQQSSPGDGSDALALMVDAVRGAIADATAGGLGSELSDLPTTETALIDPSLSDIELTSFVDWIGVPDGMWEHPNPAAEIARRLHSGEVHTVLAEIGVTQQEVVDAALAAIAEGARVAIVVGGEAKWRDQQARRVGIELPPTGATSPGAEVVGSPTTTLVPGDLGIDDLELVRNLVTPATAFAVIESAIRARSGRSIADHDRHLGALQARFAAVAANDPVAWDTSAPSSDEIMAESPENRLVAAPYTKRCCSQWNVDQAAALVFTTEATADALGIDQARRVYPLVSAYSNHSVPVLARDRLDASPGVAACATRAADHLGYSVSDCELIDLYSCFPASVQVWAAELDIDIERDLTVTGGMTFGGGPLNNYVLMALVRLAERLRQEPEWRALSTSVSGFLTKQALSVWSCQPPHQAFASSDVSATTTASSTVRPVFDTDESDVAIVGYTVDSVFGQLRLVAVVERGDGSRSIGATLDPTLIALARSRDLVGHRAGIEDGTLTLSVA